MTARQTLSGLLLALATAASAAAQTPAPSRPVALDPFEVTAHPLGADERTASTWVVTPPPDTPSTSRLADTLLEVPGLHIQNFGAAGGRETIYLRGTEENHTVVFLDGVQLNDPNDSRGGGVDLSGIEPAVIARAAVVRGPGSVRYGPDALAGTIHLETPGSDTAQATLQAETGGDGFRRILGSGTAPAGDTLALSATGSWFEDGDDQRGRMRRSFLQGAVRSTGPVRAAFSAWHSRIDAAAFPDDSGGYRFAAIRTLETRDERRTGLAGRLSGDWSLGTWAATADYADIHTRVISPGVAPGLRDPAGLPPTDTTTSLRRLHVSLMTERASEDGALAVGLDYQHEDGRSDSTIDFGFPLPADFQLTRRRLGGFVEANRKTAAGITAAAGARVDRYSDDLTRLTARAGLLGPLGSDATQWRLNLGNTFKAPSFFALAHPLVGNPDIKPETALTAEAGLRHILAGGRGLIDLTAFASKVDDAIDFDPGPPPMVANVDAIDAHGLEVALLLRATDQLTLRGSATWASVSSDPDGARMRGRPRWRGAIAATWTPAPRLTLTARLTAVGDILDSAIPTGDRILPSWIRCDLTAAWTVHANLQLLASADNLFDETYEEALGFPAQARRLRAGLRLTF